MQNDYYLDKEQEIQEEMVRAARGTYKLHDRRDADEDCRCKKQKFIIRADLFHIKGFSLLSKLLLGYLITARYYNVRNGKGGTVHVRYDYVRDYFGTTDTRIMRAFSQLQEKHLISGTFGEKTVSLKLNRDKINRLCPDAFE